MTSILNDVILNKKMKITDPAALVDAKRSLRSMLYDFLLQNKYVPYPASYDNLAELQLSVLYIKLHDTFYYDDDVAYHQMPNDCNALWP